MSIFRNFIGIRENTTPENKLTSKIKLQKGEGSKEFAPFTVNKSTHANLRHLIQAFADSPNIGVGYTTIDSSKGEVEPQLKKKSLYLTGGAVRDHLKAKTPRNYDLVTDATASEIRMILTGSESHFTETKPKNPRYANDSKYAKLPEAGNKSKVFYASRWDKQGKELEFTVQIHGEKFHLSTLSKAPKSRRVVPDKADLASTIEDDAANRDFTINSLYIPLNTADGDNSELIDPHGGAHHLKTGEIKAVGDDLESRMQEDPATAYRYLKLLNRFGDAENIPEKYKQIIIKHKDMANVPKIHVRSEFLNGLENHDSDPRKFLHSLQDTGLLHNVFPGIEFSPERMPPDFKADRWLATAWILKNNEPEKVRKMLEDGGWSTSEAKDIAYLVKLYKWAVKGKFDPNQFYDMKSTHTGLTKSKIREWMQMAKAHGPEIDSFLSHDDSDLTPYVKQNDQRSVNPLYVQILGRMPMSHEFEPIKHYLSTKRWIDGTSNFE